MNKHSASITRTIPARLVLLVAGAFAIAGCATTGNVVQRAPSAQFASAKPLAQVNGCIAPRILKGWGQSKTNPNGSGTMIIVSGSAWGNPVAIIDVQPVLSGSRITVRRGSSSDRVFNGILRTAQACR